ncbi:MAG: asparaginase [Myxococcota bacterium]|nr:asparaginase [Myxococcota bacterium]
MASRLLFIHTGGTLGMVPVGTDGALAPADHFARSMKPYIPGVESLAEIESRSVCNIDSSDMSPDRWVSIGEMIASSVHDFDGFVVLHGTDTMSFTACALSFMLRDLPRPVILTGSQRPLAEPRTDARINLVHSTLCAMMEIPEVGLYFGSRLFRGNRTTKVSLQSYHAFASPNFPPLLEMGVDVKNGAEPLRPRGAFRFRHGFSRDVAVISLFPGCSAAQLSWVIDQGARVVVLRTFGDGNLPREAWPSAVEAATSHGIHVIITSQCRSGTISPGRYEGSRHGFDAGALFGEDMTGEAVVVKSMWLLGQGITGEAFRASFNQPLAGECR